MSQSKRDEAVEQLGRLTSYTLRSAHYSVDAILAAAREEWRADIVDAANETLGTMGLKWELREASAAADTAQGTPGDSPREGQSQPRTEPAAHPESQPGRRAEVPGGAAGEVYASCPCGFRTRNLDEAMAHTCSAPAPAGQTEADNLTGVLIHVWNGKLDPNDAANVIRFQIRRAREEERATTETRLNTAWWSALSRAISDVAPTRPEDAYDWLVKLCRGLRAKINAEWSQSEASISHRARDAAVHQARADALREFRRSMRDLGTSRTLAWLEAELVEAGRLERERAKTAEKEGGRANSKAGAAAQDQELPDARVQEPSLRAASRVRPHGVAIPPSGPAQGDGAMLGVSPVAPPEPAGDRALDPKVWPEQAYFGYPPDPGRLVCVSDTWSGEKRSYVRLDVHERKVADAMRKLREAELALGTRDCDLLSLRQGLRGELTDGEGGWAGQEGKTHYLRLREAEARAVTLSEAEDTAVNEWLATPAQSLVGKTGAGGEGVGGGGPRKSTRACRLDLARAG